MHANIDFWSFHLNEPYCKGMYVKNPKIVQPSWFIFHFVIEKQEKCSFCIIENVIIDKIILIQLKDYNHAYIVDSTCIAHAKLYFLLYS